MPKQAPRAVPQPLTPDADAGFWLRVGAKLIDHGLWELVQVPAVALGVYLNAVGRPPWMIGSGFILSTVLWYVYVYQMTRSRGQTLGKMAANIQVITEEGELPGPGRMLRRLLVEAAFDMAGLLLMILAWQIVSRGSGMNAATVIAGAAAIGSLIGLLDVLYIFFSPRRQAIHDTAAGTYVVRLGESRMKAFVFVVIVAAFAPTLSTFGIVRPFLTEAYFVPSTSMSPTIEVGDRILSNKIVRRLRPPRHFEIVMFRAPEWVNAEKKFFVKRVVGVPGDKLRVEDGALYRNGKAVDEPYLPEPPHYVWPEDGGEVTVPDGHVVVLGDSRNNSYDSHLWDRASADGREVESAPFLPVGAIRGKLVYRYWPPDRMGTVAQEELEAP